MPQVIARESAVATGEPRRGLSHPPWTLNNVASVGRFLLHFAEMWIAMTLGMMILVPVKGIVVPMGYSALLDTTSIDYQAWMGVFMVVPMVAWMRVRGHGWRMGIEMAGAMLVPIAAVLALCALGVPDALPWLTTKATGPAMAIGMVAIMVYRHEHYTHGYSLGVRRPAWPGRASSV
jgi:hypothetical protein